MTDAATFPATHAVAWTDGGSRGNPGEAGAGIVLELGRGQREEHTLYLGRLTNNQAEYLALLAALERLARLGVAEVEVRCDSELVVRQMTGRYQVRAQHLRSLWQRSCLLAQGFRRCTLRHVPRSANRVADALANRAIDTRISTLPLPLSQPQTVFSPVGEGEGCNERCR